MARIPRSSNTGASAKLAVWSHASSKNSVYTGTPTMKSNYKSPPVYSTEYTSHLPMTNIDSIHRALTEREGRQLNPKYKPTGPSLADNLYRIGWDDSEDCVVIEDVSDGEYLNEKDSDSYMGSQGSLELETPLELQERLQRSIRHYGRGYAKMCIAAMRWHQLMEDVIDDEEIEKLFKEMQMIRKLRSDPFL